MMLGLGASWGFLRSTLQNAFRVAHFDTFCRQARLPFMMLGFGLPASSVQNALRNGVRHFGGRTG